MNPATSDQPSTMPRGRRRRDIASKVDGRKFVCDNAGCGRSFTRAEHLQRHLLNHSTGEHTCDRCRAHFKRRDLLGKNDIPLYVSLEYLYGLGSSAPHTCFTQLRGKSGSQYQHVCLSRTISVHRLFFTLKYRPGRSCFLPSGRSQKVGSKTPARCDLPPLYVIELLSVSQAPPTLHALWVVRCRCRRRLSLTQWVERHMARHRQKDEEAGAEGCGILNTRKGPLH